MCELYKDTFITIRVNGNIFYGPIKRMWQTFYDKVIEVFYNGEWFPAKIIGKDSKKDLIKITERFICSPDLKIKATEVYGDKTMSELFVETVTLELNRRVASIPTNVIRCFEHEDVVHLGHIQDLLIDEKSDWLFGIQFEDSNNQYYTLTDGFIISAK